MTYSSLQAFGLAAAAAVLVPTSALAQGDLSGTFDVLFADSGRDSLDVAGTWDGSAETAAGDVVQVVITNVGDDTAFDLTLSVDLPADFEYAAGTASGIPGISASQLGTTLTFSLPLGTDIAASGVETLSFGVVAQTGVTSGTYAIDWNFGFGTVDDGTDGSETVSGSVVVKEGASILTIDPIQQTAAIGDQVSWTVEIENTGLGGLLT